MPKGIATNPENDKRRLHLGGKPKTGRKRETFFITKEEKAELERRLHELRRQEGKDTGQ